MYNCIRIIILIAIISSVLAWPQENQFDNERVPKAQVGSMLAEIAKELIQRSSTSSQVLSLNLSSLLLLLVLKAVVFGAGYMGHHGYKARELHAESIISESEVALALGYFVGESCLYRAACEVPHKAKDYLGAAEILLQTAKLMPRSVEVDYDRFGRMISELKKAVEYGSLGRCPPQYTCKKTNIKNFLKDA